jgi:hypothetical protein
MNVLAVEKIGGISTNADLEGIKTGKIAEIDRQGAVFIDFEGNQQGPIRARVTAAAADSITRRTGHTDVTVMIAFEENDIHRPVVIDVVHDGIEPPPSAPAMDRNHLDEVKIDGETITFDARKEIVLRCGKSSITLTRAGKVLIRGAYLLNRSSGVNRIKGGSVQIN